MSNCHKTKKIKNPRLTNISDNLILCFGSNWPARPQHSTRIKWSLPLSPKFLLVTMNFLKHPHHNHSCINSVVLMWLTPVLWFPAGTWSRETSVGRYVTDKCLRSTNRSIRRINSLQLNFLPLMLNRAIRPALLGKRCRSRFPHSGNRT